MWERDDGFGLKYLNVKHLWCIQAHSLCPWPLLGLLSKPNVIQSLTSHFRPCSFILLEPHTIPPFLDHVKHFFPELLHDLFCLEQFLPKHWYSWFTFITLSCDISEYRLLRITFYDYSQLFIVLSSLSSPILFSPLFIWLCKNSPGYLHIYLHIGCPYLPA